VSPLLQNLSPELVQKVQKSSVKKKFFAGGQIFAEGDEATFLPIVLRGKIKIVRFPDVGKEVILGVFQTGEIFAIPPALDGKKFPATAVAMEETEILLLPRPDFLALIEESSEFSSVVMQRMCGILRDRSQTIKILATPSPEQRVATVLLRLAAEAGNGNKPVQIQFRRQDIAEMSGLTTETTIRAITSLAGKGLIKIIRRKIVIDDFAPLKNFLR
jgi:CRP-like cAMP-binding protein